MPAVDVVESEKAYEITSELPGMDEKNIEVKVADGVLTIKGEKREEKEEKQKDYYLQERSFGCVRTQFRSAGNSLRATRSKQASGRACLRVLDGHCVLGQCHHAAALSSQAER